MNPLPNASPEISVIMAVKDGGTLLRQALDSVLNQTYENFEFIIIDDGSLDNTLEVLNSYADSRLRIYSQENQGLAASLNRGLSLARGNFIARQDHDDISLRDRFEKQMDFFKKNPQIGLIGTAAQIDSLDGPTGRFHDHPTDSGVLAFELLFNNPFVHTSIMFRKEIISTVGFYTTDPKREPPEDYEFISRVSRQYGLGNLPERLVIYRELAGSLSSQIRPQQAGGTNSFSARMATISAENLALITSTALDDPAVVNFGAVIHAYAPGLVSAPDYRAIDALLKKAVSEISKKQGGNELEKLETILKNKKLTLSYQLYALSKQSWADKLHFLLFGGGWRYLVRRFNNRFIAIKKGSQ